MSKRAALLSILLVSSVCLAQGEKHSQEYLSAEKRAGRLLCARNICLAIGAFPTLDLLLREVNEISAVGFFVCLAAAFGTHIAYVNADETAGKLLVQERLANKLAKQKDKEKQKQKLSEVAPQPKKANEEEEKKPVQKVVPQPKKSEEKKPDLRTVSKPKKKKMKELWSRFKEKIKNKNKNG